MLSGRVVVIAALISRWLGILAVRLQLSIDPLTYEDERAIGLDGEAPEADPLLRRRIHVGAVFDSQEEQAVIVNSGVLCLALNGRRCHCFEGQRIDALVPELHPDCVPKNRPPDAPMWLSVQIALIDEGASRASKVFSSPGVSLAIDRPSSDPLAMQQRSKRLTFVATLVLDDLPRFIVLMRSMQLVGSSLGEADAASHIDRLLVVVPDAEAEHICTALSGFAARLNFPVQVIAESKLLPPGDYYPYAAQMAIKLLVARLVSTPFYVTLDADVVLLRDFNVSELVKPGAGADSSLLRGLFTPESRYAFHPDWWAASEAFLGLPLSSNHNTQGFGVTPAVLSTFGALQVAERVREALGSPNDDFVLRWLESFGRGAVWSEYTLYRVVLDDMQVIIFMPCLVYAVHMI